MNSKKETFDKISKLKDGEHLYFNMFQDGGAVCYKCNGMYLLFEVTLNGVNEHYEGTYFENQINDMINIAYGWT